MARSVSDGNNSADRGYSHLQQHARPPRLLSLQYNMGESWKRFKTRWANYSLLSGLHDMPREIQVAQLENCLADDALKTLEGFDFPTGDDDRTVREIMMAFERYAIGEIHETLERYKFGKRQQKDGESMDKFLADLRILMKTCQYCPRCESSILRDRIILGIRSNDIRQELLKVRHLVLDKFIDICKASETAASHSGALVPDNVNRVLDGKRDDTKECKFCSFTHPMKKEKCPAWGKCAISVESLIISRANATRLLINQDLAAVLSKAQNNTRDTPIKVGLTMWMNRPPLTTVTESGATVSPHLTRNP